MLPAVGGGVDDCSTVSSGLGLRMQRLNACSISELRQALAVELLYPQCYLRSNSRVASNGLLCFNFVIVAFISFSAANPS